MRLVTVRSPEGRGAEVAELALASGAAQASVSQARVYRTGRGAITGDMVELEAATPTAKAFVEALTAAPFFEPGEYSIAVRHPRSVVARDGPRRETRPIVVPTADIYEDLWQFSHVTVSLIGRVFLSAALIAYGMIEMSLPVMIAGLLFLPYHHQMLAIGLGVWTREWHLAAQGAWALAVSTALIVAAGACVALLTDPPMRFHEFGYLPSGFLIALAVGVAAGLASADDAGRRELIGLAATAHITVIPAWAGVSLVFGFEEWPVARERLVTFLVAVVTLTAAAVVTYALLGLRGEGVRKFAARTSKGSSRNAS